MKKIIIANWKMNPPSLKEARRLFDAVKKSAAFIKKSEIVIAPPFVYLEHFSKTKGKKIKLAGQDVFLEDKGAFTGEISASMLKNMCVSYVIIGHSERRANLGETNQMINKKIKAALNRGLKTILCVGEREREGDALPEIVKTEIIEGLKSVSKKFAKNILIVYEPIWAISTTKGARGVVKRSSTTLPKTDSPEDLFKLVIYIRRALLDVFGRQIAKKLPILYGGSVDDKNVKKFLGVEGISGLLVGGASLDSQKFVNILKLADTIK